MAARIIKTTPKDFFLYAFAAGSLYFSATTLIALLWQLINVWLPETTISPYETESVGSVLRWSVAMLIIIFPAYVAAMWHIGKEIDKEHGKTELWVRRWFIWATLFIAAVTMLGNLVYLVYMLLDGDIALRFILKAIAVGVVAKAVFAYHWYILKREPGKGIKTRRQIAIGASAFVGAAIIAAFVAAGSPAFARATRNDNQRVNDLQNLQWQITSYWQQKEELPTTLDALVDGAAPMPLPVDPKTKQPYRYQARGAYEFVLCATFETDVSESPSPDKEGYLPPTTPVTWSHAAGDTCYVRTIDPERYPPLNPKPVIEGSAIEERLEEVATPQAAE